MPLKNSLDFSFIPFSPHFKNAPWDRLNRMWPLGPKVSLIQNMMNKPI